MTTTNTSKILAQAVFLANRETLDSDTVSNRAAFNEIMLQAVRLLRPDDNIEQGEDMNVRVFTKGEVVKSLRLRFDKMFDVVVPSTDEGKNARTLTALIDNIDSAINRAFSVLGARQERTFDLDQTIPLLKPPSYIAHICERAVQDSRQSGRPLEDNQILHWVTPNGLHAVAAIDQPDKYHFVTEGEVLKEGRKRENVIATAISNLRNAYKAFGAMSDYSSGFAELRGVGGAAASLILLDDFLAEEAERAGDDLFLHAADADHLLIFPLSNTDAILSLLGALKEGRAPARVETPPMIFQDGKLRDIVADDIVTILSDKVDELASILNRGPTH
jgi:hypothetical protein|nr:hypothetical protein [Neorhizobium tomejilense]